VTVKATPNTGCTFLHWLDRGVVVSTDLTYQFTATTHRDLYAIFRGDSVAIATESNPAEGGSTSGGGTYTIGSSATVRATPSIGYRFANWSANGVLQSSDSIYTFAVTEAKTLKANFIAQSYTATVLPTPPEGGTTTGAGTYPARQTVTLTATPAAGYRFSGWYRMVAGSLFIHSSNSVITFPATEDVSLYAVFTRM
jgi:hypothetical protein